MATGKYTAGKTAIDRLAMHSVYRSGFCRTITVANFPGRVRLVPSGAMPPCVLAVRISGPLADCAVLSATVNKLGECGKYRSVFSCVHIGFIDCEASSSGLTDETLDTALGHAAPRVRQEPRPPSRAERDGSSCTKMVADRVAQFNKNAVVDIRL